MMNLHKAVKYPNSVIRSTAMELLVREYEADSAFAKEREIVYQRYQKIIKATKDFLLDMYRNAGVLPDTENEAAGGVVSTGMATEVLRNLKPEEFAASYLQTVPQGGNYMRKYRDLFLDYGLDYPWAPGLLVFHDMAKASDYDAHIVTSMWLSLSTDLESFTALFIPSSVVYLETREKIHKFIDSLLDEIPRDPNWKDFPHGLQLHVRWLYAYKRGMSFKKIYDDPNLNPFPDPDAPGNTEKIGREVRKLDRLLGGIPRQRGRPRSQ